MCTNKDTLSGNGIESKFRGVVRYYTRDDVHHAELDLRTSDGLDVTLHASLPLRPIEEQIVRQGHGLPEEAKQQIERDKLEGIPGLDAVKKLARKVASSRLRRQLEAVMNSPIARLGEGIVPGWGAAATAIRAAGSLVDRARKGDPEARQRVATFAAQAANDPRAATALALVRKVGGVSKSAPTANTNGDEGDPDQVSGWWWNVPYRTPAQTLFDDVTRPSPGLVMRGMYHRGLEARAEAWARKHQKQAR